MMKFKTLGITTICATLAIAGLVQSAASHGGATGIVKERMDNMVTMGKALGAVADMLKGKRDFDSEVVAHTGDIIIEHSQSLGELFPNTDASRGGSNTAALPAVWDQNDAFLALAKSLEEKAEILKIVADGGDLKNVKIAFGQTAKACSACHADFRKKKE
jgi:cytochrome c556